MSKIKQFQLWMTWRRMGKPEMGEVRTHERNTYPFEQGAELKKRLRGAFGNLAALSAIDLGCGPAETVVARQVLEIPWKRLVSVEAYQPYLDQLRAKTAAAARHEVLAVRIEEALEMFEPGEIDVALLIDVLEHFPKKEALRLLEGLERFVGRGIVIFSPLGEVEQDELDGNALQRHRSDWRAAEWARLGYDVEVYEGFHGQLETTPAAAWAIKRLKGD